MNQIRAPKLSDIELIAASIYPDKRWVDNGRIILSAGVSAGIDMSFYMIEKLLGKDIANETARYMQPHIVQQSFFAGECYFGFLRTFLLASFIAFYIFSKKNITSVQSFCLIWNPYK